MLTDRTERRQLTKSKSPCESKRELLRDYMARVETLKVARQEITEILMTTSSLFGGTI
jgi:hypothetical protein